MSYKEKVAQHLHEAIAEMETHLTKLVTEWVVESFKNGVETGKQAKNRTFTTEKAKGRDAGEQPVHSTEPR